MPEERIEVIVGVDTHTDTHAAVAIDRHGRRLDSIEIEANPAGYRELFVWARRLGRAGRCLRPRHRQCPLSSSPGSAARAQTP